MNILPEDIAIRLYYNKQHWFHGLPQIRLLGSPGQFGELIFDFGDETVVMRVRIPLTGRAKLLDAAYMAVYNFEQILIDKHPNIYKD